LDSSGFLLVDPSFRPVYADPESIKILGYPNNVSSPESLDGIVTHKILSFLPRNLAYSQTVFVTQFQSGRRRYLCRAFMLQDHWSPDVQPARIALLLERGLPGPPGRARKYSKFGGMYEDPFSFSPDPRYFYLGRAHHEVFAALRAMVRESRGIGISGLSSLGTSLSAASNLFYQDTAGKPRPVVMATCRMNLSRLAAALVEQHHDDKGIHWPVRVAPFHVHLIGLNLEDAGVRDEAERIYRYLLEEKVEVLFDDRDARAGEKFSDSDLLGIPLRLTISKRTLKEGALELKLRAGSQAESVTVEDALKAITAACG